MGWRYGFFRSDEPIMHCHNHFPLIVSLSNNTSCDAYQLEAVPHTSLTVLQSRTHSGRSRACVTGVGWVHFRYVLLGLNVFKLQIFCQVGIKKRRQWYLFSAVCAILFESLRRTCLKRENIFKKVPRLQEANLANSPARTEIWLFRQ